MKIRFKTIHNEVLEHLPFPIKKEIPDWYKELSGHWDNKRVPNTVKKCMPFQDALVSGYCIPLPVDLTMRKVQRDGEQKLDLHWGAGYTLENMGVETHHPKQFGGMPRPVGSMKGVIKFNMPYRIETPPGYSILCIAPMNRERKYFEIISGIIDTDTYDGLINFPSYMMNFENGDQGYDSIVIPGGTPVAHIFPFKRDSWQMSVEKDTMDHNKWYVKFYSRWANNYKIKSWKKKDYK